MLYIILAGRCRAKLLSHKKTCLALVFVLQKLRHYLLTTTVNLISWADPLKYIMSRPQSKGASQSGPSSSQSLTSTMCHNK